MDHECIVENEYDHLEALPNRAISRDTSFIGGYSTPLSTPIVPTNPPCLYENSGHYEPPPKVGGQTSIELSHASIDENHYDVLGEKSPGVMTSQKSKEPLVPAAFDSSPMQYECMDGHGLEKAEKPEPKQQTDYVNWIFRIVILLLLVAIIVGGYFCYYFNQELAKFKEIARNEEMKRTDGLQKVEKLLSKLNVNEKKNEINIRSAYQQRLRLQIKHQEDFNELKAKLKNETSKKHQKIYGNMLQFDPASINVTEKPFVSGLVQVWFPGIYRQMECYDKTLTNKDANSICKTMGYSKGGFRDRGKFDANLTVTFGWTFPYSCHGNETSMLECPPFQGVRSEKIVVRVKCDNSTIVK